MPVTKARRRRSKFRKLLHGLPQELYDQIFDLTFPFNPKTLSLTFPKPLNRDITANSKPPKDLHINHELRESFSALYYGTPAVWTFSSEDVLERWIKSLPQDANSQLQTGTAGARNLGEDRTFKPRKWTQTDDPDDGEIVAYWLSRKKYNRVLSPWRDVLVVKKFRFMKIGRPGALGDRRIILDH